MIFHRKAIFSNLLYLNNLKTVYAVNTSDEILPRNPPFKIITKELWCDNLNERDFSEVADYITNPNVTIERQSIISINNNNIQCSISFSCCSKY